MATNAWVPARNRPAIKPSGLTASFLQNPLLFMRTHSMSPPSDSGNSHRSDFGSVAGSFLATGDHFALTSMGGPAFDETIERRTGAGGIRHVKVINHTDLNFVGATCLQIAAATDNPDGSWLPVYFLPWQSLKILSFQIPSVPQSLAEWDDDEYPRFFFTAGINGCSVFAQGNPHGPTISHAGINNKLAGNSMAFWRKMMKSTGGNFSSSAIQGEIHSLDYMAKDAEGRVLSEKYLKFLSGKSKDFKLDIQSPFGCIFGIRYGRAWTLYLQRSVMMSKITFYKESEVRISNQRPSGPDYFLKNTTQLAMPTTRLVQNRFGGMPMPGKKEEQVYAVTQNFSLPLELVEMFPNRRTIGELQDVFKAQ